MLVQLMLVMKLNLVLICLQNNQMISVQLICDINLFSLQKLHDIMTGKLESDVSRHHICQYLSSLTSDDDPHHDLTLLCSDGQVRQLLLIFSGFNIAQHILGQKK